MSANATTYSSWVCAASAQLAPHDSARLDAELLLCHVTQENRSALYARPKHPLSASQLDTLATLLDRRTSGEPLSYITGTREFWSLPFSVQPGVLVPRPETELLVEHVLGLCSAGTRKTVIDAGTGSGAIAISVLHTLGEQSDHLLMIATDTSNTALQSAQGNARTLLNRDIHLVRTDWLSGIADNSADIIVSNPPYIRNNDEHLQQADLQHEPAIALASGVDGLDAIRTLVRDANRVARDGCQLLVEHGYDQAKQVRQLMLEQHYTHVRSITDLAGIERVSIGTCRQRR